MPFTPIHIKPPIQWLTNFLSCCPYIIRYIPSFCKVPFGDAHAAFGPRSSRAPVHRLWSRLPRPTHFPYSFCSAPFHLFASNLTVFELPVPTPPFYIALWYPLLPYLVLDFLGSSTMYTSFRCAYSVLMGHIYAVSVWVPHTGQIVQKVYSWLLYAASSWYSLHRHALGLIPIFTA